MNASPTPLRHVVVIGAGIVGLSTAWHLRELGVEVTVLEREHVGAGASWGNAGWLSPGLATPLPEPGVPVQALKSMFDAAAPLYVAPRVDPGLWRFLWRFARYCTQRQWDLAMANYLPINALALEAYDELTNAGVDSTTSSQPIIAVYENAKGADPLRHEVAELARLGSTLTVRDLSSVELRERQPIVSAKVTYALAIEGQRYFDPGHFVNALADSLRGRGVTISTGTKVTALATSPSGAVLSTSQGAVHADAVVLATGAWLSQLGSNVGVRTMVRGGRGYSFSVPTDRPVTMPLYLPARRIACTPYRGGLRIGGTMEFRPIDAAVDQRRVDNLVRASRPMLEGVRFDEMSDVWVGPRPVSVDGMPLIGRSGDARVFVAGGHGMWGITLGPITGKLLAQMVVTGEASPVLAPFDPRR